MLVRDAAGEQLTFQFSMVAALMVAAAGVCSLGGCEQANPPGAVPELEENTPEAKLEKVMVRLRTAVADASAAAGSGVVSQRSVSHELIPPKGEQDKYRAEITIQTTRSLARPPATQSARDEEQAEAEEQEPVDELDPYADEDQTDQFLLPDEEAATEEEAEAPADVTRRVIAESRETKSTAYELVYDNERWKLVDEISAEEDEVAKYLFEFALAE